MRKMDSLLHLKSETSHSYVCGNDNPHGLKTVFVRDGAHGCRGSYVAAEEHCGWPGILHGGITFALMDEALAWAARFQGLYAMTARATTRYRNPISAGSNLLIRAWTLERRKSLITAHAEVRLGGCEQILAAETDATMYLISLTEARS
jgi:acyl-coenzyme A thioesterase PaaI-like protein